MTISISQEPEQFVLQFPPKNKINEYLTTSVPEDWRLLFFAYSFWNKKGSIVL